MHLNYHFLRYLCPVLDQAFCGRKISACFSQSKDELIIQTELGEDSLFIRAHFLPPQVYYSFPENFKRAKRNSIDLFPELIGDVIIGCKVIPFERAFYFELNSGAILLLKLHGNRSNILLYQNGASSPSRLFRNEISEDKELDWKSLIHNLTLDKDRFRELEGNASKFLPTLGSIPRNWLKEKEYPTAEFEKKWALMQELLDILDTPLFSLVEKNDEVHLSLLPEDGAIQTFSDPIQALNTLFFKALVQGNFEKEKRDLIKRYGDQLKRNKNYVDKASQKLEDLKNSAPPSQLADVIMANLHLFGPKSQEVELFDFYTNQQVQIKLKPNQKAQDYASQLYRKNKNRQLELDQIEKTIHAKLGQIKELETVLEELESLSDFRQLKRFQKEHKQDKSIQREVSGLPFKNFEFDGFQIWVGKSAKDNDEMLRNFAHKDDIWLHARQVPGSHVIIKTKGHKTVPPRVLERAASLAAFYSKYKTEHLAPVIHTEVKYVRKVKGSAPGSVMVDRESVIMVGPAGPDENTALDKN
ncbi:NFACT RNA binding domain-containing protein [Algoriphagus sp. CAU 1675]|uniref:NFACT RNA binding domain-containing protein n=1 Tax=Algoriphagus sp. CAU 1675 TaxID=3032597 RepID=UPI0023DA1ABE|nr:NFACT RNA binding domain-containing protein [Algoriphagus sp. CAU 1675]MDF2158151.1 NFACT RNA binding domain-containing protein [Algoriphagus sp. CAU 1675]